MMISAIVAGKLVGRISIKVSMAVGVVMSAVSMLIYSVAGSISMIYDRTGNYNMAWIAISVITAVTIVLYATMLKPQRKK